VLLTSSSPTASAIAQTRRGLASACSHKRLLVGCVTTLQTFAYVAALQVVSPPGRSALPQQRLRTFTFGACWRFVASSPVRYGYPADWPIAGAGLSPAREAALSAALELPHVRVESPEAMLGIRLRLLTCPLPQFLHTDGGRCHYPRASPRLRSLDQPGPFARTRARGHGAAPALGGVPWRYPRFIATTGPAATPLVFDVVAGAYLAPRSFSPGPGGLLQFRVRPFSTMLPPLPRRSRIGVLPAFRYGVAFAQT
jgi:hypothetical protein